MKPIPLLTILLAVFYIIGCDKQEEATPNKVVPHQIETLNLNPLKNTYEYLVNVLASDSLNGRWTHETGIDRTEKFVIKQISEIGLQELPRYKSFKDGFKVVSTDFETLTINLNNQPASPERIIITPQSPQAQISLNQINRVVYFSPTTTLKEQVTSLHNTSVAGQNYLVLVPLALQESFQEFKSYFPALGAFVPNTIRYAAGYPIRYGYNNIIYVLSDTKMVETFTGSFKLKEEALNNVVAVIPGKSKPNEYVIFSAHMDHLGMARSGTDRIYNGANDNASGTAAVITLAKYFKEQNLNERTLLFVLFNAEEKGLLGSKSFVNAFPDKSAIKAVFNIDMIGNISPYGAGKAFLSGHSRSTLQSIMNKNLQPINTLINNEPAGYDLFARSDNYPFAQAQIPAHTITTFNSADRLYHTVADEISTLDLHSAFTVVKTIAQSSYSIIKGTDEPKMTN
ncbi:M20/M25/M40 family metallo-hydrolase [Adhaeribacter aquaticus]|uniref:M20/M25/M40 family metallo-hydrolase n=1 Tax=Adhaeribacter aquaticus TaxID=299567 RepID=UPI00041F4E15|nr:M20/M25/M40 family metallo-hydrolase [Adhaeribacter aquaticus]